MSTEEWEELSRRTRQELVADFQLRFPQLTTSEAEALAVEVENAGLYLIDKSIRHGVNVGFDQAEKAYKFSMAIRTVCAVMLAPLFIMVGAKLGGENSFGLALGGLLAAVVFYLGDEAVKSLRLLLKKEKKDAK